MDKDRVAVVGAGPLGEELRQHLGGLGVAEVESLGEDFWDSLSLGRLRRYDCVVTALGDPVSLVRLNQMCLIAGVDLVVVALDGQRITVECYPFRSSAERACLECNLADAAYSRVAERYTSAGLRRAEPSPDSTATPGAGPAAPAVAEATFSLRHGDQPPARRLVIDAITGGRGLARLDRSAGCAGCEPFQAAPRIVRTRNRWCARVEGIHGDRRHVEESLRLSDALITRYECPSCGPLAEAARYVNRRAEDFDETIATCPRCGSTAVQIEVRHTFRLGELMERFGSEPVPAKYALLDTTAGPVCIDLEDAGPVAGTQRR